MDIKQAFVNLAPSPLVRALAAPYIAGKGIESGVGKADEIWQRSRLHSTVDLLGEELFAREDVEATVATYFRMVEQLKGRHYAGISLKPTQLGLHDGEAYCLANIRRVVARASEERLPVTIDMEDRHVTDVTLRMFKAVRDELENVGIVLQSRLYRTKDDIAALPARRCRVRICIGIYLEPKEVAYTDKATMKERLFEYVQRLLDAGHYPEVATHDEALIRRVVDYLDKRGCPKDAYEFQMLLGVPRANIQAQLVGEGRVVRLYVPFAEEWKYAVAYCKRRLAGNPMMGAYVMKNLLGG